ncbi:DUF6483 family protein [Clostridium sp.]|uniref:DUF6483 family protein n=1 Tax=Clostridium sp. TaxID=1506 RepID=UPI003F3185C6
MAIKNDWLLDQIENLTLMIAKVFFKKSTTKYEIENVMKLSETDLLYKELQKLLQEGNICEAENILYKNLQTSNIKYLEVAVDFYESLNLLEDEELEKCNFSREEVNEGLIEILVKFNIDLKQFNINT